VAVGAEHADVYMLWGEPVAQIAERIARIRAAAAAHGRAIRFSLSVRPIVAATEEAAWERAEAIRSATARRVGTAQASQVQGIQTPAPGGRLFGFRESSSVGSERLQQQGAEREVHDERLWYGVTRLSGPGGNSTALVGTPRQVAEALLAYRRAGVDAVLIRGFDPLDDVIDWGAELVPLLREQAAATPVGRAGSGAAAAAGAPAAVSA
jgi:alkanesulfonate monooxygenase